MASRSTRKSIQLKGTHVFQKWLRNHIDKNDGFDRIVYELITSGGSTYANPAANYYRVARDPTALAETTAQLFFGIRMQCAKCHNHPFERWSQDDYYSMAAFFARVKQRPDPIEAGDPKKKDGAEYVYVERTGEVIQPRTSKTMAPKFIGGKIADIAPGKDRRIALAEWMAAPNNPFVPKSVANRVWFHLMGRGIVHRTERSIPMQHIEDVVFKRQGLNGWVEVAVNDRGNHKSEQIGPMSPRTARRWTARPTARSR